MSLEEHVVTGPHGRNLARGCRDTPSLPFSCTAVCFTSPIQELARWGSDCRSCCPGSLCSADPYARGRTTAFNGASAWDFSSGHVPRATHPHDSCAPAIERQLEALNMPFHCPEVSVVCPASRPYPGALGFRPALVPNWRLALRSPWHAHMQRSLEPGTPGALFRTMASTKTDTRCAAQCGKMPGMPGRTLLRAARSLRLRAHAPPCAEVVCAVDLLAFLVGLLY